MNLLLGKKLILILVPMWWAVWLLLVGFTTAQQFYCHFSVQSGSQQSGIMVYDLNNERVLRKSQNTSELHLLNVCISCNSFLQARREGFTCGQKIRVFGNNEITSLPFL